MANPREKIPSDPHLVIPAKIRAVLSVNFERVKDLIAFISSEKIWSGEEYNIFQVLTALSTISPGEKKNPPSTDF